MQIINYFGRSLQRDKDRGRWHYLSGEGGSQCHGNCSGVPCWNHLLLLLVSVLQNVWCVHVCVCEREREREREAPGLTTQRASGPYPAKHVPLKEALTEPFPHTPAVAILLSWAGVVTQGTASSLGLSLVTLTLSLHASLLHTCCGLG